MPVYHTFIAQTNNGEIEFDVSRDKITVNQTDMEPSYISFELDKEDWEELKKFIDEKLKSKSHVCQKRHK